MGGGVALFSLTAGVFCRMPCKMQPSTFAALIVFRFNVLAPNSTIVKAVQRLFVWLCLYIFFLR